MAGSSIKKGSKMVCVPCGREVVVDNCGVSDSTLWCCETPMKKKAARTAAKRGTKGKK